MTEQSNATQTIKKSKPSKLLVILIIALGLLLVLGIGLTFAIKSGLISPMNWLVKKLPPEVVPIVSQLSELNSEQAKMAMMMETGQSGVCTITSKDNSEKMIYYMKNGKLKIETNSEDEGVTITGYILNDGEWQYTWDSTQSQGTKSKIPSQEEIEQWTQDTNEFENFDPDWDADVLIEEEEDDRYDIKCDLSNVEDSVFVAPDYIEFIDLSSVMDQSLELDSENQKTSEPTINQEEIDRTEELIKIMQEKYRAEE